MNPKLPPARTILSFGLQVLFGFVLPPAALGLTFLIMSLGNQLGPKWAAVFAFAAGIAGVCAFAGGIALAVRGRWKGMVLGLVLFGAVILLLIAACFAMFRGGWNR